MIPACAPCRKSGILRWQCACIVQTMGQSHGAFTRKRDGARTPESSSRLPLCISGDGVLWCCMCATCRKASDRQEPPSSYLGQFMRHPKAPSIAVRARQLTRANRPGTQESDTRRMVQFLNPWDWLNAQVRGLVLAASAWASPRGAGISSSLFTLSGGVGGGFRWYLPLEGYCDA